MGYNGNNRGRTHNWSGAGSKRNYKWGAKISGKTMAAPFVILGTLLDLVNDLGKQTSLYSSSYYDAHIDTTVQTPSRSHILIEFLSTYYTELSQRISILSEKIAELLSLRNKLKLTRFNIFLFRKRSRIINVLSYKILRKEQFISSFKIVDEAIVGEPISCNQIKGTVAVNFSDQAMNNLFDLGIVLRKRVADFQAGLHIVESLALKDCDWQIIFYSKGLILEDEKQILYVPYQDVITKEKWIIHYANNDSHGYDILRSSWRYPKLDGGPDLRYSNNYHTYYVQRYQVELLFNKAGKNTSLYFIFQNKEDSETLCKIISPKTIYDQDRIEKVKLYGYIDL